MHVINLVYIFCDMKIWYTLVNLLIYQKELSNILSVKTGGSEVGLFARKDKSEYIDLNILENQLIDRRSKCDFSKFVEYVFKY